MQKILQSFHYFRKKNPKKLKKKKNHFIYFMKDVHIQWMEKSIYREQYHICDEW